MKLLYFHLEIAISKTN